MVNLTPKLFSDSIEFMGVYIALMREREDFREIPDMLHRFNKMIFASKKISKDELRQLAVYATEKIYRFATELELRDAYTVTYFKSVIAPLMASLQQAGVHVFYILDNDLRPDRFELTVMLFELSGAAVVSPYRTSEILSFEEVEVEIKGHMARERNIIYIEKDARVNYIESVIRLSAASNRYMRLFRNYAPSTNYLDVL